MANLRKCTSCKSEIDISYFGMSRKKEPYKTCDNCRNTTKNTNTVPCMTSTKYFCYVDDISVILSSIIEIYLDLNINNVYYTNEYVII